MKHLPLAATIAVGSLAGVPALGLAGCVADEDDAGSTSPTPNTCTAVCPKLIACWEQEAGSANLGYGYGYGNGYLSDGRLGYFTYAGYDCGYGGSGSGDGYGYGSCSEAQVHERAVELCLQGCYANIERNQGQVQCLAEQACPALLSICVGADIGYGY